MWCEVGRCAQGTVHGCLVWCRPAPSRRGPGFGSSDHLLPYAVAEPEVPNRFLVFAPQISSH